MIKKAILALCLLVGILSAEAQVSINSGNNNLEISGVMYPIYNLRFRPGTTNGPFYWPFTNDAGANLKSNKFEMRNIQLSFEGRYANQYEYQLQFNFSKLFQGGGAGDPENPALMDANVSYVGNKYVKVKVGWQKIPYSRSSITSYTQMPFIQRAEVVRGEAFSRRDIGVVLYNSFWNQRINLFAGAFSGQGESILLGDNDRSGNMEVVGRAEVAYPSRYRYREIDDNNTATPMVVVGVNARSNTRKNAFAPDSVTYGLKNLNGTRNMWGFDVSAQYRCFSAQFEWHQMQCTPTVPQDYLQGYQGVTDKFYAGGFLAQLNYNCQPLRSVFSIRYDRFNSNDLVGSRSGQPNYDFLTGTISGARYDSRAVQENLVLAYNLKLSGWNSVLRAQYTKRIKLDESHSSAPTDDQLRLGFQYIFR